jgi:hypothetical protein
MTDLTFTRSNELDVTQVEGNTDRGIEFVDSWFAREMMVVDAGRIILAGDAGACSREAERLGLTAETVLVAAEQTGGGR